MEQQIPHKTHYVRSALLFILVLLLIAGLVFQTYSLLELKKTYATLESQLRTSEEKHNSLSVQFAELGQRYAQSEEDNAELQDELEQEQDRNKEFEDQIEDLSGTVGKLDKLSKIDPELLQKYSKVYFLNEHYIPSKVTPIDKAFVKNSDDMLEYIHREVAPFLDDMLEDAKDNDISLFVASGYRSFDEQAGIKSSYSVQYGTGANTFSADQGYSEHQLGTTVDFTSEENGGTLNGFQNTKAYAWLLKNAHRYGFTLSYPEGNAYYVYEPWHWRFVGEDLARDLHDDSEHFYDLDQRKIDTYLISLFD